MSVELEVARFLTAFVVALKPDVVIETGTGEGYSARALATGLRANNGGHLWTVEIEPDKCGTARRLLARHGLTSWATVVCADTPTTLDIPPVDLLFVDSNQSQRVSEVEAMLPRMSERGVILAHDSSTVHQRVRAGLDELARKGAISVVHLPTPRGLSVARRWRWE